MRRIAEELPSYTDTRFAPRSQAFIDAQQEIERAMAVPRWLGVDVHNHVERLLAANAWRDPKAAAQYAEDAYLWLVAEPLSLMPRWYRRLVSIVPRWRDQHDAADPGSTSVQ